MRHNFNPLLYGIVDITPLDPARPDLVGRAVEGGVTVIQARGKAVTPRQLLQSVRQLLPVCRHYRVPLLVNDRPDVAAAAGADGVHLGQDDVPAAVVRRLHPEWIIGISVHSAEELSRAVSAGADYVASGSLFATGTKADAVPINHIIFSDVCRSSPLPVLGIGGITIENAGMVRKLGASGVAVINGLWSAPDVRKRAEEFTLALGAGPASSGQPISES